MGTTVASPLEASTTHHVLAFDGWRVHLTLLIASALYAVTIAILVASYRLASGHFIDALDDTYINMPMAKNFAMHGV
jgi:hypothetical protein